MADGAPVAYLASRSGKSVTRTTGADLVEPLAKAASEDGFRALIEAAFASALETGEAAHAATLAERALAYPPNLGEGKLPAAQDNNVFFLLGRAHAALGQAEQAREAFERAASGPSEPSSAMYYNDQPPDMIFYQGLARRELGRDAEARQIFAALAEYGAAHLNDAVQMDYFAVSLPTFLVFDEDLGLRNQIHCHYMRALGLLGLGEYAGAQAEFAAVLALDANHQGAIVHRALVPTQPVETTGEG